MPDIREEFEAWVSGRKVCTRYGAKLTTNPDGMYSDYRINDRWLAWQASRAALLKDHVPMPRQCPSWLEDAYDDEACRDKHYIDGLSLPGYEAMLKAQEEVAK